MWRSGYTNYPLLGEYNSREKAVIKQHLSWAKEGGIDFFAVNWMDSQSFDDITLKDYFLPNLDTSELKFCIHYDSSGALNLFNKPFFSYDLNDKYSYNKTKGQKFLEDFEYLADNYFSHPRYLKIDGKPVVIIYVVSAFRNISPYFEQLKVNMAKRNLTLFLIADVICWSGIKLSKENLSFFWETPPKETMKVFWRALRRLSLKNYEKDFSLNKYFVGLTDYNMYATNRISYFLENVDKVYQKFWQYTKEQNLCFIPNIMPGYDDRNRRGLERPILERKDGKFYKDFWQIAKKYLDPSCKIALITSFNEWHEGTELEPSKEYGTKYLELTKLFKNKG
jgi:hypothetical protein